MKVYKIIVVFARTLIGTAMNVLAHLPRIQMEPADRAAVDAALFQLSFAALARLRKLLQSDNDQLAWRAAGAIFRLECARIRHGGADRGSTSWATRSMTSWMRFFRTLKTRSMQSWMMDLPTWTTRSMPSRMKNLPGFSMTTSTRKRSSNQRTNLRSALPHRSRSHTRRRTLRPSHRNSRSPRHQQWRRLFRVPQHQPLGPRRHDDRV